MKSKHWLLLSIVPLSEIKAIFYNSNLKVSWYLFSKDTKFLCNVLEDYSNIFIFSIILYFLAFTNIDKLTRQIATYLFILNSLDVIHLGIYDMQGLIAIKLIITIILTHYVLRYGKIKSST